MTIYIRETISASIPNAPGTFAVVSDTRTPFGSLAAAEERLVRECRALRVRKGDSLSYFPDSVNYRTKVSPPIIGDLSLERVWQILDVSDDGTRYAGNVDWHAEGNLPASWGTIAANR